jgi:hypothetical protein
MPTADEITEAEMLAELKAISNKSSDSRFDDYEKKIVKTTKPARASRRGESKTADSSSSDSKENNSSSSTLESNTINFLQQNPEDPKHNQYWYSQNTITAIVSDISRLISKHSGDAGGFKVAFLSTPSLYFALSEEQRKDCFVFDYDRTNWSEDRGYVFYDFNEPKTLPEGLEKSFHLIVIDPPFITREVWEQYEITAKFLLKGDPTLPAADTAPSNLIIGTTVAENAPFMNELLGCKAQVFKPSIPNLVYQYNCYCNFSDVEKLGELNPEIPE